MSQHRRSSKGNLNHWPAGTPKGGQFAPKGAGICYMRDEKYYDARDKFRNGELSKEEFEEIKKEYSENTNPVKNVSFTPAKSVSEAEEYCRSLGVEPYYKGLDLDTCNALNESLTTTLTLFPKTKEWLSVCGSAQEINKHKKKDVARHIMSKYDSAWFSNEKRKEQWAKSQASRLVGRVSGNRLAYTYMELPRGDFADIQRKYMGVYINSNNQDLGASMEECERTGFHPVGCNTKKSVVDHEMGHLIHAAYGGLKLNPKEASIKSELSEYAMENIKEYHAEAWAEFCNNPHPRKRAREVGEEFLRRAK